ncbi:MAG: hypothetical protein SWJ54_03375 [Cyanobacteriota bacterium]|nr:hypothetical protein [Cyanobacteriota bacterium]
MSMFEKPSEPRPIVTPPKKPRIQPRFLVSLGVTAFVVAFIWQLSEHPEWFELDDLREVISNSGNFDDDLSDEDRAVAADIDSSAVLFNELEGPQLSPYPTDTTINAGRDLLDEVRKSGSNPSEPFPTTSNSLSPQDSTVNQELSPFPAAPSPTDTGNLVNINPAPQLPSSVLSAPGTPTNLTPPTFDANFPSATVTPDETSASDSNPLQAAMDQYNQGQDQSQNSGSASGTANTNSSVLDFNSSPVSPVNPTTGVPTTSAPVNGVVQPSVQVPQATWVVPRATTTPTTPTSPTLATPYQTNNSITQPVIPSQPIIPPTRTGAAVTPDIQSIYNSYGAYPNINPSGTYGAPYPNYGASTPTTPGVTNNSPNSQNYQVNQNTNTLIQNQADQFNQMNQRPFSAPRPVPGRRIGGGQIRTFANP